MEIAPGDRVIITDTNGADHEVEALSGVEHKGHDFPVVWVRRPLRPDARPRPSHGGRGRWHEPTERMAWPADAVRPADD
jgi:hypothetical protein